MYPRHYCWQVPTWVPHPERSEVGGEKSRSTFCWLGLALASRKKEAKSPEALSFRELKLKLERSRETVVLEEDALSGELFRWEDTGLEWDGMGLHAQTSSHGIACMD